MRRLPEAEFFVPEPTKRKRRHEEVRQAILETRHTLVLTHGRCLDGVGSFLVHAMAAETPPTVVYSQPNEVQDVVAWVAEHPGQGRTLSINDLSFDRGRLNELVQAVRAAKEAGWRIVWRDHHHKQWEDVDIDPLVVELDGFRLDRESQECGTSLVQEELLPDDPVAREFADIVRDRDLWRNEDPRSERYEFALRHLGTEAFVEGFLATRDVDAPWIKAAAEEARRTTDEEVEKAVLTAEVFGAHHEVGVIYGEVPKNVTLHALRNRRGTRLEINLKPNGVFSVRSAKGTDVAHLVAQAYGGGGHPNAAGGKVPVAVWEWPAYWLKGGLSPSGMSVVRTALRLVAAHDAEHQTTPENGTGTPRRADQEADVGRPEAEAAPVRRVDERLEDGDRPASAAGRRSDPEPHAAAPANRAA